MARPLLRAPLGALLFALTLSACDDGGLTAPDGSSAAGDDLTALLDEQLEVEDSADLLDAATLAERAGTTYQPITGPTTITQPGVYLVTADFSLPAGVPADAIVVQADNVYLDLGGHTITGPGNKIGRGVAVMGARRVLVSGGTLETFGVGVDLFESTRTTVAGVHALGGDEFADPDNGVPAQVGFQLINSPQNRIIGNYAVETNLGIFVRGPGNRRNRIQANVALAGNFGLLGICYNPAPDAPPDSPGPSHDRVTNNFLNGFATGIQVSEGSAYNSFINNRIYYLDFAWTDENGTNVFQNNQTMQL